MGRTVPTQRLRIEQRIQGWAPFRRALRIEEKAAFDEIADAFRNHAASSGLLPAADPIEPLLLSLLLEVHLRLRAIETRLNEVENG
jgi:hypothetical protein